MSSGAVVLPITQPALHVAAGQSVVLLLLCHIASLPVEAEVVEPRPVKAETAQFQTHISTEGRRTRLTSRLIVVVVAVVPSMRLLAWSSGWSPAVATPPTTVGVSKVTLQTYPGDCAVRETVTCVHHGYIGRGKREIRVTTIHEKRRETARTRSQRGRHRETERDRKIRWRV